MKRIKFVVISIFLIAAFYTLSIGKICLAEEFPYREKYPEVTPISSEDLHEGYLSGDVIIVDVRSEIEYKVIHPKKSKHIAIAHMNFIEEVGALIKNNPDKKIAFYCNGITCLKSYEATKKAVEAGYENCFAYDAGIPDWAEKYPQETLLIGEEIINPQEQIIPKSDFQAKCLSYEDFKNKGQDINSLIIDVRDNIQKSGDVPGLEDALNIPLDKFIVNFVEKEVNKDRTLFIFDQVGKQVRWLMYYLVKHGYTDYYFLNKGATDVIKKQEYK